MKLKTGILSGEDEALFGAKHILTEYGIPFDVITDLKDYPLIIVPSSSYLDGVDNKEIINYLNTGGNLIICGNAKNIFNLLDLKIEGVVNGAKLRLSEGHSITSGIENHEIRIFGDVSLINSKDSFANLICNGFEYSGVIARKNIIFFPFELCKSIIWWETESYAEVKKTSHTKHLVKIYTSLPDPIRYTIRGFVRRVRKKIAEREKYTSWPIDYNADVLKKLLVNSISFIFMNSVGVLPMLNRWPNDHKAAVVITHDIDTDKCLKNLPEMLKIEKKYGIRSTSNFIAKSKKYKLDAELLKNLISEGFEVASHGLYHEGIGDKISTEDRRKRIEKSKEIIENLTDHEIVGYRAPHLLRTEDFWKILEDLGFKYDMSFPDIDHLTMSRFGMGVSSNVPYNPVIKNGDSYNELNLLELPLTAPQDTNLFVELKMPEKESFEIWKKKVEYVMSFGGLSMFVFHPTYFDKSNIMLYDNLLEYFIKKEGLWITTANTIADWWNKRKNIEIDAIIDNGGIDIKVYNKNSSSIHDLSLSLITKDKLIDKKIPIIKSESGVEFSVKLQGVSHEASHLSIYCIKNK